MRRRPFRRQWRAWPGQHLPLPHVPESVRGDLWSPGGRAQTRLDARAPTHFQSSNRARRGFCRECGTPLTFEPDDGPVELAIGAFDAPARIPPTIQHAMDARLPWLSELDSLQERGAEEAAGVAPYYASIRSLQHPDHET